MRGDDIMLIVREVVTTKPGQASKLAKLFKKVFAPECLCDEQA
jgi:hypothetical protein